MIGKLMKGFKKNNKGFTLVELMVVVVIIGILVAIAVPVYNSSQAKAKENAHQANIRILKGAGQQYITDKGIPKDSAVEWTGAESGEEWNLYIEKWPANPNTGGKAYKVTITTAGKVDVTEQN
jgi:prepilin-type N-terminal cleavage/methylation domain-containing protein